MTGRSDPVQTPSNAKTAWMLAFAAELRLRLEGLGDAAALQVAQQRWLVGDTVDPDSAVDRYLLEISRSRLKDPRLGSMSAAEQDYRSVSDRRGERSVRSES